MLYLYYIINAINNKAVISCDDKNSYSEKPRARAISYYFEILSHNTQSDIEHLYAFYII